jgi:Transposase
VGDRITYVGLDVHKEGIVVAVAEGGLRGEVREYGRIANTAGALDRLMRKLGGEGVGLRFCYEAGPCGYGIQRHLSAHGHECVVVAPSLIPKRAGDRVKTDRRDAASLARLHRAGELTAVWVPDAAHEAITFDRNTHRGTGRRVKSRVHSPVRERSSQCPKRKSQERCSCSISCSSFLPTTATGRAAVKMTETAIICLVGALLHLSRKHRVPTAPANRSLASVGRSCCQQLLMRVS